MATKRFTEVVDIVLQISTINHNLYEKPFYRFSAPDGQFRVEEWDGESWTDRTAELGPAFEKIHQAALEEARFELNTEPVDWPEFDEMAAHVMVEMGEAVRLLGGQEKLEQMIADAEAAESAQSYPAYCCDAFKHHVEWTCSDHEDPFDCPDAVLVVTERGWGFPIRDGGTSVVAITHCPWCGSTVALDDSEASVDVDA